MGEFYGMTFGQSTVCFDGYRKFYFPSVRTKTCQLKTLNNNRFDMEPVIPKFGVNNFNQECIPNVGFWRMKFPERRALSSWYTLHSRIRSWLELAWTVLG